MSNVKRRRIVGQHTVRGRVFEVERIEWTNTDGLSFDVYDTATGERAAAGDYFRAPAGG